MALAALPIQTLASEWGKGDSVYAAMLGDYVGSDGKSYGDKRNYTFMYYKSDGNEDTSTRYASTHAKLRSMGYINIYERYPNEKDYNDELKKVKSIINEQAEENEQ